MLIAFKKSFVLEGEYTDYIRKHFWSKPKEIRRKAHIVRTVSGVCDGSCIKSEVERLIALEMEQPGWGKDFSGWQRELSYEEVLKLSEEEKWNRKDIPTGKVEVAYITTWKMDRILKTLTGEQFVQFCKENGLGIEGIKNV